jgi:hypothetical protein
MFDNFHLLQTAATRSFALGSCVAAGGLIWSSVVFLWSRNPKVLYDSVFVGKTLLKFATGTAFLTELTRELRRDKSASLVDSFLSGTGFGILTSKGPLQIKSPRELFLTSICFGATAAFSDYCLLKIFPIHSLSHKFTGESSSGGQYLNKFTKHIPFIGERSQKISQLKNEINHLESD